MLLWLLPLLFARAFIPTGFMLGEGPDGFGLVVCSGTMPMPPASQHHQHPDHSAHAGHNHYEADNKADSGSDTGTDSGPTDHSSHRHSHGDSDSAACPFAIGACAAFIDVPYLASLPVSSVDEQARVDVVPTSGIATPRANPIRGPPQSS